MILKIFEIAFVKLIWVPVIYIISKVFMNIGKPGNYLFNICSSCWQISSRVFQFNDIALKLKSTILNSPLSVVVKSTKKFGIFTRLYIYTFPLKYFAKVWYFHIVHLSWMNEKCDLVVICMSSSSHLLSKLVSFPWTALLIHVQVPVVYCLKVYCI